MAQAIKPLLACDQNLPEQGGTSLEKLIGSEYLKTSYHIYIYSYHWILIFQVEVKVASWQETYSDISHDSKNSFICFSRT